MGWSGTLTSNKEITFDEVEKIVNGLPTDLVFEFVLEDGKPPFQGWGWVAATDIYSPAENTLSIGGCYGISGNMAETMANHLKEKLEENGHSIEIEFHW